MNDDNPNPFESMFGKIEPNADLLRGAGIVFQQYTAYLDAGFTPAQSMQMVTTIMSTMLRIQNGGGDDR